MGTNPVFSQLSFLPNDISKAKNNLPEKIKTIRQYNGNLLLNVREYDTLKNLTFSYYKQYVNENWNGKYITMVTGNQYDRSGKIKKSFRLHSNAGLSIWYYEYDNNGNNIKLYMKDNSYEERGSLTNTNPYHFISEINNFEELINHPKIKEIDSLASKYLHWERTYDSNGNMLTEATFNPKGDTSGFKQYAYDRENNNVYFYNEWSKQSKWEYYYEYTKEHSIFGEHSDAKPSKLLQSVRVSYDASERRKRVSDITLFKYDEKDRLIETVKFERGEFQDKYIYEYDDLNRVIKRVSYVYNPDKKASEETYTFNREGNVIRETDKDFRTGEKKEVTYRYEYEYFD